MQGGRCAWDVSLRPNAPPPLSYPFHPGHSASVLHILEVMEMGGSACDVPWPPCRGMVERPHPVGSAELSRKQARMRREALKTYKHE